MIDGLYPHKGVWPTLGRDVFVAPGARIIGDVVLGDQSSVWFNCVLRGDVHQVRIGARSNIQDGTVIHVTRRNHGTFIGEDVLIGHMALVHGCTLERGAFVGMGAVIMDGCVIEEDGMIAAGGMLTPGKRIGARQMWAGRPARYVRDLTADELKYHADAVAHYVRLAKSYLNEYAGK
jgi:carbonic anhydrase/acetyltransferase-like protein (isoleucine patch superfamily)